MSSARKRNVVDNLEQVTQDLIDYILTAGRTVEEREAHQQAIISCLRQVQAAYNKPMSNVPGVSSLTSMVQWFSRQRAADLASAIQQIETFSPESTVAMLNSIATFLKDGACDSTSANTFLLQQLIAKLPQYDSVDADVRLNNLGWNASSSKVGVRAALREIFVRNAEQTMRKYEAAQAARNAVSQTERNEPGKLDIGAFANRLANVLTGVDEDYSAKTRPEVGHNVATQHASIIAKLETVFGAKVAAEQVTLGQRDAKPASAEFTAAQAKLATFFGARQYKSAPSSPAVPPSSAAVP